MIGVLQNLSIKPQIVMLKRSVAVHGSSGPTGVDMIYNNARFI